MHLVNQGHCRVMMSHEHILSSPDSTQSLELKLLDSKGLNRFAGVVSNTLAGDF